MDSRTLIHIEPIQELQVEEQEHKETIILMLSRQFFRDHDSTVKEKTDSLNVSSARRGGQDFYTPRSERVTNY